MATDCNTLNQAKVITAQAMLQEGYITQEQFHKFLTSYAFVTRKAGMWDKILERIWGRPQGDSIHFDFVKVIVVDDNQTEALRIVENFGSPKTEDKAVKAVQQAERFERIQ